MKIENNKLNNEPLSGNFTSSALGRLKIQTSLLNCEKLIKINILRQYLQGAIALDEMGSRLARFPLLFGRSKIPKGLF